jgi:hypothetical protein
MIEVKNINLEYKAGLLFGFCALIMSLLTGILMGIKIDTVLIRSFIITVVFSGIGIGAFAVLRRYVPEVYELLASVSLPGRDDAGESGGDQKFEYKKNEPGSEDMPMTEAQPGAGETKPPTSETSFNELDNDMMTHYTTTPGQTVGVNTATGKLGKHVLKTEKLSKYEPHLMAQAVRTMMSKDQ